MTMTNRQYRVLSYVFHVVAVLIAIAGAITTWVGRGSLLFPLLPSLFLAAVSWTTGCALLGTFGGPETDTED